jgi:hypothetical protein
MIQHRPCASCAGRCARKCTNPRSGQVPQQADTPPLFLGFAGQDAQTEKNSGIGIPPHRPCFMEERTVSSSWAKGLNERRQTGVARGARRRITNQ